MDTGKNMRKKETFLTSQHNPPKNCKKEGGNEWGILPDGGRNFKNFLEGAPKNRFLISNVEHFFALCE